MAQEQVGSSQAAEGYSITICDDILLQCIERAKEILYLQNEKCRQICECGERTSREWNLVGLLDRECQQRREGGR